MTITHALESYDLTPAFFLLAWFACLLSVWLMQISWKNDVRLGNPSPIRWFRRASIAAIALSLGWIMSYADVKGWQPWPPFLALMFSLDFYFVVRIAAIYYRDGSRLHIWHPHLFHKRKSPIH